MLRLTRWVVDLLIIFAGALVTLDYFGVNPTAALLDSVLAALPLHLRAEDARKRNRRRLSYLRPSGALGNS